MSTTTPVDFGRLAPVLKARTVIKRRIDEQQSGKRSPANMLSIADNLAMGWLDEHVRLQRQGAALMRSAESAMGEVIDLARSLCREREVESKSSLLFFTMLEGVRQDVRDALQRVALCGLALAITISALTADGDDDHAKRIGRAARVLRRRDEVTLRCAETGGVL